MHSLRRGITGRISSMAAVCAMLLLSLAPVASQMLKAERFEALLASLCASGTDAPDSQLPRHAGHHALSHLDACGYCDLVGHAPAPPTLPRATPSAPLPRESFTAASIVRAPAHRRFADAQPRAPPAFG
ncbi:DUF2946 domain-containing protein [Caballeronia sp. LZ062]|uniref:DUF2946 domain-containing protein n=1 Tax=unclassified Caballeronia TaxID=2646786 RepID=UPI00285BCB16|nr:MULTISPECIES: DUF2946 domain-containing protein [unclassified Caballeronia]MDR5854401.1 DUF2946 domain-containing protein [Caballeronia sp. LZ050]MDR5871068.1 DUF2946 domain-containing protein [Caballeronia sp. LZ062]